jgi:hypothetical protein
MVWAARLGLLALALNSLVPIHIAFDLAEALAPAHHWSAHTRADAASTDRHLLALLVGHRHAGGKLHDHGHGNGHGTACPVCSALGALTGLAAPAATLLAAPAPAALPVALSVTETVSPRPPASYRSRAPPLA